MRNEASIRRWLQIARGLLECPTAALKEEAPVEHVLEFAARRPALRVSRDRSGNLLLKLLPRGAARKAPPLVLVAHLDHPAFWIEAVSGRRVRLRFQGGVGIAHARRGTRIAFFRRGEQRPTGRGRLVEAQADRRGGLERATAVLETGQALAGGLAMWDFPGFRLRRGKIVSRGCDDLLGCAVVLCVLDECLRSGRSLKAPLWGLLTRSEELGFYGALRAVDEGTIPRRAGVLSLECSRALSHAPQGQGVIVRVGDRSSIFDPFFTECLTQACIALRKRDPGFRYQRRLMDGGTCEATVFCQQGYRCSGLALPLGNYHNQAGLDGGTKRIGAEHVAVSDFAAEIRLLLELSGRSDRLARLGGALPRRLARLDRLARLAFQRHPLD